MTAAEDFPVMLQQNLECVVCARRSPDLLVRLATGVCTRCAPVVIEPLCAQCGSDTATHRCCGEAFDYERGGDR